MIISLDNNLDPLTREKLQHLKVISNFCGNVYLTYNSTDVRKSLVWSLYVSKSGSTHLTYDHDKDWSLIRNPTLEVLAQINSPDEVVAFLNKYYISDFMKGTLFFKIQQ